jgi:hypothetical protein
VLTLAEIAREHVDTCDACRLRWERGTSAVDAQRMCRSGADPSPRPYVIVFVAGARACKPGTRTFIERAVSYEVAETMARRWNVGHDLAWGTFEVES